MYILPRGYAQLWLRVPLKGLYIPFWEYYTLNYGDEFQKTGNFVYW